MDWNSTIRLLDRLYSLYDSIEDGIEIGEGERIQPYAKMKQIIECEATDNKRIKKRLLLKRMHLLCSLLCIALSAPPKRYQGPKAILNLGWLSPTLNLLSRFLPTSTLSLSYLAAKLYFFCSKRLEARQSSKLDFATATTTTVIVTCTDVDHGTFNLLMKYHPASPMNGPLNKLL